MQDKLLKNGKETKEVSDKVDYICSKVSIGESLHTILPYESESLPDFVAFNNIIDGNAEFKEKFSKACDLRSKAVHERFFEVMSRFLTSKDKEDLEVLKGLAEAVKKILNSKAGDTISIIYESAFPESFWEDSSEFDVEADRLQGYDK